MQKNAQLPTQGTSSLPFKTLTLLYFIVLAAFIFLAACGSSTNTGSSSTPSSTLTSGGYGNSRGNGYGGKYGSGGSSQATATTAATDPSQTVTMMLSGNGFAFSPATLTVSVGTTIIWKNTTSTPHTVTSDDGKTFDSGNATPVNAGGTFSFKFTKAGTFNYHCNFHPSMTATIIVK